MMSSEANPSTSLRSLAGLRPAPGTRLIVLAIIAALIVVVYLPVRNHTFVDWDDNVYITENPNMRGLSWAGVRWAFTAAYAGYWIPLPWISHLLDVSLFGIVPGAHHLTNVLLHAAGAMALLLALEALSGAFWPSAFVAALFAVHPLHVESVAWVTERKDVLSGLCFFLTLLAYARYARKPGWQRYLPVLALYTLGLLAKPILVTLPFVLLLLDWWPLGRVRSGSGRDGAPLAGLVLEKIPLGVLTLAFSVVTVMTQSDNRAMKSLENFPLSIRVGNAVLSYILYLRDMVWPARLSFFYPHPGREISWAGVTAAGAALAAATVALILLRRRYLTTGWLWYLGILVPVSGLMQSGIQGRADRFVYLPLIGIYIMVAWGATELLAGRRHGKTILAVLACAVIAVSAGTARHQVGYWKNDFTLFGRGVELDPESWMARNLLAVALNKAERPLEAIEQLNVVMRVQPQYSKAWLNLGVAHEKLGRTREAVLDYEEAIRLNPRLSKARFNLGLTLLSHGDKAGAQRQYEALQSTDRAMAIRLGKFLGFAPRQNR